MYANYYKKRDDFLLTEEDYNVLYLMAKAYAKTTKWDKIFLLKPHQKGIVDDGERYMPDSDFQIRKEFFGFLRNLYDEFRYKYEILDGTYYENYVRVKEHIDELLRKAQG